MTFFLKGPVHGGISPCCATETSKTGMWLEGCTAPTGLSPFVVGKGSRFLSRAELGQDWVRRPGLEHSQVPCSKLYLCGCGCSFVVQWLVSYMASLHMRTVCSHSEPYPNLSSFFDTFTSYMDHTPAFSVGAKKARCHFFPPQSSCFPPFSVLLAFSFKCLFFFPWDPELCRVWFFFSNRLKQFVLPWQGDAKTKHVCLLFLN